MRDIASLQSAIVRGRETTAQQPGRILGQRTRQGGVEPLDFKGRGARKKQKLQNEAKFQGCFNVADC
jgi:hypothetical protein